MHVCVSGRHHPSQTFSLLRAQYSVLHRVTAQCTHTQTLTQSVVHHSSDIATPTLSSPSSSPSSSTSSTHSFPPLTCGATERALLLAFALKWRRETDTMTADQMKEFEREIWRSHIRASVEEMQRAVSTSHALYPPTHT